MKTLLALTFLFGIYINYTVGLKDPLASQIWTQFKNAHGKF